MYTTTNFKTKKAIREAIAAGAKITVYAPGHGTVPVNGTVSLEGPHYPAAHTWYGTGTMQDGVLVKIK